MGELTLKKRVFFTGIVIVFVLILINCSYKEYLHSGIRNEYDKTIGPMLSDKEKLRKIALLSEKVASNGFDTIVFDNENCELQELYDKIMKDDTDENQYYVELYELIKEYKFIKKIYKEDNNIIMDLHDVYYLDNNLYKKKIVISVKNGEMVYQNYYAYPGWKYLEFKSPHKCVWIHKNLMCEHIVSVEDVENDISIMEEYLEFSIFSGLME